VVFLDELDTPGQRRTTSNSSGLRSVVNQLLTELDGLDSINDAVFALAATNQPWQVDPALRRPGRFDRTILVLPPDQPARAAIFQHCLASRPVTGIDLTKLAERSDGLTGADITYVCETAAERALMDSVHTGTPRLITMTDLTDALTQVHSSIGPWLETARNVVMFGEDDGTFAELKAYLKAVRRW
jgi:SpoVK/Ycf46/Vps4 family AAA+-type ATPase